MTSPNGVAVAHYFESCALEAYPDPGSKDGTPWTIGWGHTGPEVVKGLKWTQRQSDDAFLHDLLKFEGIVDKLVKVAVTQGQRDALVLFCYNVGPGDMKRGIDGLSTSTLLRLLNAGDYAGARLQFARWNKNDGKVMRGLIRRRAAEAALWDGRSGSEAIAIGVKAA
jgi:lysozyme